MKTTLNHSSKIIALTALVIAAFAITQLVYAEPTQSPPNGNVAPPINTSSSSQVKAGGVGLGSLIVSGDSILATTTIENGLTVSTGDVSIGSSGLIRAFRGLLFGFPATLSSDPQAIIDIGYHFGPPDSTYSPSEPGYNTYPNRIVLERFPITAGNNYIGFNVSSDGANGVGTAVNLDYITRKNHRFYTDFEGTVGGRVFSILEDGDVVIGTDASPSGTLKLDVAGQIGATEYCDENGANCIAAGSLGGGGSTSTVYWDLNGSDISNNNAGDVGIGDTTPDGTLRLDVEGAIGATQYCDQNGANCVNAGALGGASSTSYWTLTGNDIINNNTGDVGIGVTPQEKLHTTGNLRVDGRRIYLGGNEELYSNDGGALYFDGNSSTVSQFLLRDAENDLYGRLYGSANGSSFGLLDGAGSWTFHSNSGRHSIGTGTVDPTAELHVNGAINTGREGVSGTYNSSQVQGIWSIDSQYNIDSGAGNDFGSQYGITYAHQNAGTGTKRGVAGQGHQVLFTTNGTRTSWHSLTTGNVGASAFCDNNGANCSTPAQINNAVNSTTTGSSIWSLNGTAAEYSAGNVNIGTSGTNRNLVMNGSINNTTEIRFLNGLNHSIGSNGNGLIFDGGDGTPDFLVYDERVYADDLTLGYADAGAATISTYDANENLTIDPSGSGKTIIVGNADVTGDHTTTGSSYANDFIYTSDGRLKDNLNPLVNYRDILKLDAYTFNWNDSGKEDVGFVAQEVEKLFPEFVQTRGDGYKAVSYGKLVAPLLETVKDQQEQIDSLEKRLQALEAALAN